MLKTGYILGNRYQVIKALGQGGQSNVYLLKDLRLKEKQWVAKEMTAQYSDPKDQALAKKHFEQEANLLATLEHPNLPKVIDYFSQGGKYYLVMSYLKGEDLGRLLERKKQPFDEEDVASWMMQIATVLYYLHRQNKPVIFRDIKPSNIMLHQGQVKLIDFGIARHFNPSKKGDTLRIGSPGYSPPEQYSGQTDPRSDIYSLGVTMHQLLTAQDPSKTQTPFKFGPIKALNPKISSKMVSIVEKCIQLEPEKRYQTALDLKNDLKTVLKTRKTGENSEKNYDTVPVASGSKTVPTPPPVVPPEEVAPRGAVTTMENPYKTAEVPATALQKPTGETSVEKAPASKKPLPVLQLVILTIAILAAAFLFSGRGSISRHISAVRNWLEFKTPTPLPVTSPITDNTALGRGMSAISRGDYLTAANSLADAREEDPLNPKTAILLNNALCLALEKDPVKIALVTDADETPAGGSFLMGAAMAQARINGEGGIRGRYLYIQTFTSPREESRMEGFMTEIAEAGPMAVVMTASDKLEKHGRELSEKNTVPLLIFGGGGKNDGPGTVRWKTGGDTRDKALVKLAQSAKIKKIVIIRGKGAVPDRLKEMFADNGIRVMMEVSLNDTDSGTEDVLNRIKAVKADGVLALSEEEKPGVFLKALSGIPKDMPLLLAGNLLSFEAVKILGNRTLTLTATPLYEGAENTVSSGFILFYKYYFKDSEPDLWAAGGYDLVNLSVFLGRKAFPQNSRIYKYLEHPEENDVFTGIISSLPLRDRQNTWARLSIQKGRWKQTGGLVFK